MPVSLSVSVSVFARDEGLLLHGCMTSVTRAVSRAQRSGIGAEIILVLYDAFPLTRDWADSQVNPPWKTLFVTDGRRGMARQAALSKSEGRLVTFIDASQLWSENWIEAAVDSADELGGPAVWRHELVLRCGASYFADAGYGSSFQPHLADGYNVSAMLLNNPFASSFLADRETLVAHPFPIENGDRGWTDSDWWWNCNLTGSLVAQHIVPETFLYERPPPRGRSPVVARIGPTGLATLPLASH